MEPRVVTRDEWVAARKELLNLDVVPKGRDEDGLAFTMSWVRHHDRYGADYAVDPKRLYEPPAKKHACCASHVQTVGG